MTRKTVLYRATGLNRVFYVVPAIAMVITGCSTVVEGAIAGASNAVQSGQKAGGATYIGAKALPSQMTTAPVTDPGLGNRVALDMTIPAGWKLQGIMMHPSCTPFPSPVTKAYSPDGLSQLRQEPLFGWRWDSQFKGNQSGCADISSAISAADFLKFYLTTLQGGVHVVGPMPVPEWYSAAAQKSAAQFNEGDSRLPAGFALHHIADTAALRVQVVNGTFVIEKRLRATVDCGVNDASAPAHRGHCFARVDVLSAPQGSLDALVRLADNNNLPRGKARPDWQQALMQQLTEQNRMAGDAMLARGRAQSAAFSNMMNNAFQQSMARSRSEHQAFMAQQEASFRSSMNNANAKMNARSTAASDWVDYALDQQTVRGPEGTAKVSSAYAKTWSNGQGQWYMTTEPTDNPNGFLQGTWTENTVVHGNGQPK
jgi:hypothetical protein